MLEQSHFVTGATRSVSVTRGKTGSALPGRGRHVLCLHTTTQRPLAYDNPSAGFCKSCRDRRHAVVVCCVRLHGRFPVEILRPRGQVVSMHIKQCRLARTAKVRGGGDIDTSMGSVLIAVCNQDMYPEAPHFLALSSYVC